MKTFRKLVRLNYTSYDLRRIWQYCEANDVRHGGRYDAHVAHINVWSRPWATEHDKWLSAEVFIFHFRRGRDGGLWGLEWQTEAGEEAAWCALGRLETLALGRVTYGLDSGVQS